MAKTMKVRVELTVEVDLEMLEANYGIVGAAEVREDVKYSVLNGVNAVYPEDSNVVVNATLLNA